VQFVGKMNFIRISRLVLLPLAGGLLVSSCFVGGPQESTYLTGIGGALKQDPSRSGNHPAPAIPDDVSYWDGDSATGSPAIRINRGQQKAFFYKGGVLVGISRISSGNEDHNTPPGKYKIIQKSKDHRSSIYGVFKDIKTGMMINDNVDIRTDKVPAGAVFYNAPMPNFMRFTGGIGMHTGYLPGYAASHGCIRMPHHMSTHFFENVQVGTPVTVE
jgi:L,D-transpeptidase catalytic domain